MFQTKYKAHMPNYQTIYEGHVYIPNHSKALAHFPNHYARPLPIFQNNAFVSVSNPFIRLLPIFKTIEKRLPNFQNKAFALIFKNIYIRLMPSFQTIMRLLPIFQKQGLCLSFQTIHKRLLPTYFPKPL